MENLQRPLRLAVWRTRPRGAGSQWQDERRRAALRRQLLEQDLAWARRLCYAGPRT